MEACWRQYQITQTVDFFFSLKSKSLESGLYLPKANTCTIALGISDAHIGLHRCPLCITTNWMLIWPLLSSVDQGIHS